MKRSDDEASAGMYFFTGILFFLFLFMAMSLAGAVYSPKSGDVVPCDNIYTVAEKHARLGDFGMEYTASFTNGRTVSLYDYNDYVRFPDSGKKVWPRYVSYRMRSGATLESWVVVDTVQTGTENTCIITDGDSNGEMKKDDCQKPKWVRQKTWDQFKDFNRKVLCTANDTFGFPWGLAGETE